MLALLLLQILFKMVKATHPSIFSDDFHYLNDLKSHPLCDQLSSDKIHYFNELINLRISTNVHLDFLDILDLSKPSHKNIVIEINQSIQERKKLFSNIISLYEIIRKISKKRGQLKAEIKLLITKEYESINELDELYFAKIRSVEKIVSILLENSQDLFMENQLDTIEVCSILDKNNIIFSNFNLFYEKIQLAFTIQNNLKTYYDLLSKTDNLICDIDSDVEDKIISFLRKEEINDETQQFIFPIEEETIKN
jgi:hypothetical protein